MSGDGALEFTVETATDPAAAWEDAWGLARDQDDAPARAVADRALGELALLRMSFTQVTETERLLREAEGRRMSGSAVEKLNAARAKLAGRNEHPHLIRPTGAVALASILINRSPESRVDPRLESFKAPQYGSTLAQIEALAKDVGLDLQMAYHADKDVPVEVPSVAHLSMGHYAAILARNEAGTRYLVDDPVFGVLWMTRAALLEEVSGYFLIDGKELPTGWHAVDKATGDRILGRCNWEGVATETTPDNPCKGSGCCGCSGRGMATYDFLALVISLRITDTPVGYTPARGPAVDFKATYIQKEATQPQIFTYSNLGPRWTFDQLSFIEDENPESVKLHVRGGGQEAHLRPDGQDYAPHHRSQNVLVRTSADRWEVRHPDGSLDVYAQPDCETCSGRRVFMTESRDSVMNTVSYAYDDMMRLVAITDALGQVTTVSYDLASDPWKITSVTDPFERSARFDYDAAERLVRITDVIGLVSEFQYRGGASADFITALTTPYGTTTFRESSVHTARMLEATDPLGGKERIDYRMTIPEMPNTEEVVPARFEVENSGLQNISTYYWDKRAMALYGADYSKAEITRWFLDSPGTGTGGVIQSEKKPLESRVWYTHAGVIYVSAGVGAGMQVRGALTRPTRIGRVLDDGSSQSYLYEYNPLGKAIRSTDPLGRTTISTYAPNNIDLLEVKRLNGQKLEVLQSYTYRNDTDPACATTPPHLPCKVTDAAGATTTYTYTPSGHVETVTNAANETTTYTYEDDRLHTVTGPGAGTTTTYEYDGYGRVWKVTDPEGYQTVTEYDALDRPTKVTYPDGTWEETVYDRLDAAKHRDRTGRWTHTFYDALRRVVFTRDAAGRTIRYEYEGSGCSSCAGAGDKLTKLVDANGNETRWEHDDQGRITKEIRANGAEYAYTYETTTSRLKSVRDPKGNVKTSSYNRDGTLAGITYAVADGTAATPDVSFTYDPVTGQVLTMTDGTGTTTYAYYAITSPPTLGAGRLKSVDGPLDDDTIEYVYDSLGRVTQRQIGSAANTQTQHFDSLGRLDVLTNPLGSFTYTYEGNTGRPATLTYPNGQSTTWAYYDNLGDRRLREIHNKRPGGATLSRFEYTYDKAGNILTWLQQADADPPKVYSLGYDTADQLTAAILSSTDPTPQILKRYYYAYDSAGNRTAEQIDDAVTGATHNNMNQLLTQQAGGALVFKGTVSEPAAVTVGGRPATVTADNKFEGQAVVPGGTGQVAVTATDPSGNVRTSTYQVSQGATSKSFAYDLNGNMTSDGTRTYEWDAENRLVAVSDGTVRIATFEYDGIGRRIAKTVNNQRTTYLYTVLHVAEERSASGVSSQHYYGVGIDNVLGSRAGDGQVKFYVHDKVGSVREITDDSGSVSVRRDYDVWGAPTAGGEIGGYAFTGREWEPAVSLYYYRSRYYAPSRGQFLADDPEGRSATSGGYGYALGNPIRYRDPSGRRVMVGDIRIVRRFNVPASEWKGGSAYTHWTNLTTSTTPCCQPPGSTAWGFDGMVSFDAMINYRFGEDFFNEYMGTLCGYYVGAWAQCVTWDQHEMSHAEYLKEEFELRADAEIKTSGFGSRRECDEARARFKYTVGTLLNVLSDETEAQIDDYKR